MASDQDDSIKTVVTCEGNISDPDFPIRLSSLLARLRRLLFAGNKPFRVTNVEPWNSVRVTFNIPREAAYRLRLLAQAGDRVLQELGILSVQIEGDQVISLTIAGRFNEPQEIILQPVDDDQPASSSNSSSFDLGSLEAASSTAVASGSSKSVSQYLGQSSGSAAGPMAAVASTSSAVSTGLEGFAGTLAPPPGDFKSPNVVAPGSEPIPFPPKSSSNTNPLANIHHPPSRNHPTAFGPFPFASMTHAMNTMHGSQGHHPVVSAASAVVAASTVTTTPSPSPSPSTSPAATRFPFSAPPSFHHPPSTSAHSTTSPFQPVRHTYTSSSSSSANVAATVAAVAAGGGSISAPPGLVLNNLPRGAVDRANAALMSPLLVNLLQSDMSGGQSASNSTAGSTIMGKHQSQSPSASSSEANAAPVKRKRKPRKPKEKPPSVGEVGVPATSTAPSSVGSSPRASPLLGIPLAKAPTSLVATAASESLSPFAQPHNIANPLTVPSIPLSPPSLTPPSASPPSSGGGMAPPPFITTATDALAVVVSAGKGPSLPPPSHSSFVVGCHHHHQLHRQLPLQQPQLHHHHLHNRVPPLPSPPPTAPSSSASTSNNSGQSSQEAEHELSPWPSPSPAKRAPQHLVNPFTGQLEPMSSEEEEEEVENMDDDDDFGSSVGEGTHTSSNDGSRTTPLLDSGSSSASSTSSTCSRSDPFAVLSDRALDAGRRAVESHRLEGVAAIKDQIPLSPSVSQSPVASVGSPGEKIKLRLKLDCKERARLASADKPKPAKMDFPSSATTCATSHQYKMDVPFVNNPNRRMSGAVGGGTLSNVGSDATFPVAAGARGGSPTGVLCYGIAGSLSTTPEPRVPPLHISLRGRNAAVVTSPRRGEKARGSGRARDFADRPSRGLSSTVKGVGAKGRTARGTGKLEGARGMVSVSAAAGGGTGTAPFRVATMAGRRASNIRGGVLSRRGRGAANFSSSVMTSAIGRIGADVASTATTNDVESQLQSPDQSVSPSVELVQEHPLTDADRTSVSPSGGAQQHLGRREQTLLSGGSTLVLDSNFPRPPSPSSTPIPVTTTAAQSQHVQVPNVLHPSKNLQASATTLVSSVQIPRRDSEPTVPATAVVNAPRRRPSLHERTPIHRPPPILLQESGCDGSSRTKDTLRVAADVGSKERGEVLTRFGIKVKNIGQHHRSVVEQQHHRLPVASDVSLSADSGHKPLERRPQTLETAGLVTTQTTVGGGEHPSDEQQRCRPEDLLQSLLVRGVKIALPEVAVLNADSCGSSSTMFSSPTTTIRSQRTGDENTVQRSESRSPVVRQIVLEHTKVNSHHQPVNTSPANIHLVPTTSDALAMAMEPAAAARNSQRAVDAYCHQHIRNPALAIESPSVPADGRAKRANVATSQAHHSSTMTSPPVPFPSSGTIDPPALVSSISDGDNSSGVRLPDRAQQQTLLGDVTLRTPGVSQLTSSTSDPAPNSSDSSVIRGDIQRPEAGASISPIEQSQRVPDVPFSQTAPLTLAGGKPEHSLTVGRDAVRPVREARVVPFGCRSEAELAGSTPATAGDDVPSVEKWVQQSCDGANAVDDEDDAIRAISPVVPTSDAEGLVEVPCGDAAHAVTTSTTSTTTTSVDAPLVPRGVLVQRGHGPILTQEKLRLVSSLTPARQLVSAGVDGEVLLEGVVQGAGHVDEDETEYMTREVAHHHHNLHLNRRHHHHHLHHHILNSTTTLSSTTVSIVTVSSSSPCSASPSGSSPDSLNAGTSSEENGDHAVPPGRGGNGAGSAIRHRHFHPGSQCNSSGSPYEDSGIESMDATGLEKVPGNESPGDAPEVNVSTNHGIGHRPAPPLPPPPDAHSLASGVVARATNSVPIDRSHVISSGSAPGEVSNLDSATDAGDECEQGRGDIQDDHVERLTEHKTQKQFRDVGITQEGPCDQACETSDNTTINCNLTDSDENTVSQNKEPDDDQSSNIVEDKEDDHPLSSSLETKDVCTQDLEVGVAETPCAVSPSDVSFTDNQSSGGISESLENANPTESHQPIVAVDGELEITDTEETTPEEGRIYEAQTSSSTVIEQSDVADEEESHLLTSVVFQGDQESLDLVGSCFGEPEGLALGEDDLSCVSPSEETTQLLVFTVEDVDSIVMTENSSELSLVDVTHHENADFNDGQGTSAAIQFSPLTEDHLKQSEGLQLAGDVIEADPLPTVGFSIAKGQKQLENCIDAREGLTVVQVQLSNVAEIETPDSTTDHRSDEVAATPSTNNHLASNSDDSVSVHAQRNFCPLSSASQGAPAAIQFVSLSPGGAAASQMLTETHGGSEENGDVAMSMPPTAGLFQSVSPVKLVMSRLRHPAVSCASCSSSTVTLTTVLVKSQGSQNSLPPSSTAVVAAQQPSRPLAPTPHFVPNLVPLDALSPTVVTPAPPLVRLAVSGSGGRGSFYCSSDSVPPPASTILTAHAASPPSVDVSQALSSAPVVKTQGVTDVTNSSPMTSCAPTLQPLSRVSSDLKMSSPCLNESGRRRDSTGSDSDTSGSVLSGVSCDGVYRRPLHRRDGSRYDDEDEEEDDDDSYARNISITSGDHNYIFRASRTPPIASTSRDRARLEQRRPPTAASDGSDASSSSSGIQPSESDGVLIADEGANTNDIEDAGAVRGESKVANKVDEVTGTIESSSSVDHMENSIDLVVHNIDPPIDTVNSDVDTNEPLVTCEGASGECSVDPESGTMENDPTNRSSLPPMVTNEEATCSNDCSDIAAAACRENGPVNSIVDDDVISVTDAVSLSDAITDNEVVHSEEDETEEEERIETGKVVGSADDLSLECSGSNSGGATFDSTGKFGSLTIEIPLDLEVSAEVERRSTRSTRSSSRLSSPGGGSRLSTSQQHQQPSVGSPRPSSRATITSVTTNNDSDSVATVSSESALRALPTRSAAKRKREDSDSESERRKGRSSTPALVLLTNATGPLTPVSLDRDGGGLAGSALDIVGIDVESCPPKGPSPTEAAANQFFTKPVKRKCSENAVELIKACIGIDDTPKRVSANKLSLPVIGNEPSRINSNRAGKGSKEDGSKSKGQNSTSGVSEESSDDEVTLSELVTKVRSTKSRPATSHAEERSVTRNAKQRQNPVQSEEEDAGVVTVPPGAKGEKTAACRVNSRRDDGRIMKTPAGGAGATQRESRKEERNSARLGGRIVSEKGRRVSPPPPTPTPSTKGPERANHRAKAKEERVVTPPLNAKEEPDGKRKLRSSGSSGYYDSLPQKRRRFSRDHR